MLFVMRACNFLFTLSNQGNKDFLSSEVNCQMVIAWFYFLFRKLIIELEHFRVGTVEAI